MLSPHWSNWRISCFTECNYPGQLTHMQVLFSKKIISVSRRFMMMYWSRSDKTEIRFLHYATLFKGDKRTALVFMCLFHITDQAPFYLAYFQCRINDTNGSYLNGCSVEYAWHIWELSHFSFAWKLLKLFDLFPFYTLWTWNMVFYCWNVLKSGLHFFV